jgi:hypothetical protein
MRYYDAARSLAIREEEVLEIATTVRGLMGEHGLIGLVPEEHLTDARSTLGARAGRAQFQPRFMPEDSSMPARGRPASEHVIEMGIARGGKIRQQIMEDTYGAASWDEAAFRDVVIHIVNSEVYQHITGREAPPSPITDEQYRNCNIPWYSDYQENAPSLSPVTVFKRILSIGQIDKNRGVAEENALPTREIRPEEILRIRTPSLEERWKALVDRAVASSKSGHNRIAAREASLALDLPYKHPLPFFIRALSNHRLGHHADAEADASECLNLLEALGETQPDPLWVLSIRAYSSLALGEVLLAKEDAEKILAAHPDDDDGLYVRAEANLQLKHYEDALSDAERILKSDPEDQAALRIKAEALTKGL